MLYIVSPSCGWCEANEPNIAALAAKASGRYRFIGISLADKGIREYQREHNPPFPIFAIASFETATRLGLGATPQTVIISPQGRLLRSWNGAYMARIQQEVEGEFGVTLPGVRKSK